MLIWGSAGKSIQLRSSGTAHCPTCERQRTFKDVLVYRYAHIWYLFRWVTRRTYLTVCEVCGRGIKHDRKRYEADHGSPAIPAFDRFGGWLLLALIAAVVVFAIVDDRQPDTREAPLLTQPRVGDLYSAKLDTFSKGIDARA